MRWQRILRPALGLFALAFAIWVGVSIRGRKPPPPSAMPTRTDPDGDQSRARRGQSFSLKGAAQDVRIDYDKLFTYQSGRSRFVGAKIIVTGRAGRDFEIRANEAEIAENQSQIDLRGAVVITTSDGLKVETETATYTESDGVTRAPGPGQVLPRPHDRLERRRQLRPPARRAVDARPGAHHGRARRQGRRRRRRHRRARPATPSATATSASSAA